jgi:HTH-type transcriptional regulator/antitoxin HigA
MLALKSNTLTNSFLGFASEASNILHIKTDQDYSEAIEIIDYLFDKVEDSEEDPLNDLIDLISRAIEKYELIQENIIDFHKKSSCVNQEISVLRVLMTQHNLNLSDFKNEIGSKSLVSMILNGKRNLTKEHIAKLSRKFNIDPSLFFNFRVV